jgi:ubiquinone/menaquinone biosynthesis C-methylase UbiE
MTRDLKEVSKEVSEFYDHLHQIITFPGNSVQSYRTAEIGPTHEDIIVDSALQPGMKVLDAGCGLGAFDYYAASKINCDITAITFSPKELEKAKKFYADKQVKGKLVYRLADFHFMRDTFADDTFDMVMFLESFEHAYDKEKVLRDAYALLKKGGSLFIKFHFLLWLNADGREAEFNASVKSETDNFRIFSHVTLPDFIKLVQQIGFLPVVIKVPGIQFDFYKASMDNIAIVNKNMPGFNYSQPNFQVTQCYNVLLKKA